MKRYALGNSAIVPLYQEPSYQAEMADEALYGMKLEILDEPGEGWYHVQTHYLYEGYVPSSFLLFDEEKIEAWDKAEKKVVLQDYADVLSKPSVRGWQVLHITRGGLLSPIGQDGKYVKVRLCDGQEGYLPESYLGPYYTAPASDDEDTLREMLVKTALTYTGAHYRWGGKSPLGVDCSGLCSMAYLLNGVIIERDAHLDPRFCMREIPMEQIKKGDLIFFPGHVAMYLGEGRYLHSTAAAGSERVRQNSLRPEDDDYREDLKNMITSIGTIFPLK